MFYEKLTKDSQKILWSLKSSKNFFRLFTLNNSSSSIENLKPTSILRNISEEVRVVSLQSQVEGQTLKKKNSSGYRHFEMEVFIRIKYFRNIDLKEAYLTILISRNDPKYLKSLWKRLSIYIWTTSISATNKTCIS